MEAARKRFDWREFLVLWGAGLLGVIAVLPYALALQGISLARASLIWPVSPYLVLAIQVAQNGVLLAAAVGLGLLLAARVGLGAPLVEAWLEGRPVDRRPLWRLLLLAASCGVVAAVIVIALDLLVFAPRMPVAGAGAGYPSAWQGLLASFYGGISEELLLRLFGMSLLAWGVGLLWREAPGRPAAGAFWVANLAAALLFGLGHLPATAGLVPLTGVVVVRAVVLNGIPGLVFGHLYWRRGLEAAMAAHFSADVVLHVLVPLMVGSGP